MAERTDDRLARLLALVAHVSQVGEATVPTLANRLGVTEDQVRADIDLLWITGLPGYWTNDMVDFDADALEQHGVVRVTTSQGLDRPLRLGSSEAIVLVASLRALLSLAQDIADDAALEVLRGTLEVLTAATGEAAGLLDVEIRTGTDASVLQAVERARQHNKQLRIIYTDVNDVTRERTIEPLRVEVGDGRTYVHAWADDANAERTFRADRIREAAELDTEASHQALRQRAGTPIREAELYTAAPATVRLRLHSQARHIAETVPSRRIIDHDDGTFTIELPVQNRSWLENLVAATAREVLEIEPEDLAEVVATRARATLDRYRQAGCPTEGSGTRRTG